MIKEFASGIGKIQIWLVGTGNVMFCGTQGVSKKIISENIFFALIKHKSG